jgi:hypothetical protein
LPEQKGRSGTAGLSGVLRRFLNMGKILAPFQGDGIVPPNRGKIQRNKTGGTVFIYKGQDPPGSAGFTNPDPFCGR